MSAPVQSAPSNETCSTGKELAKYEPYPELVSRRWFAAATSEDRPATRVTRLTRLDRTTNVLAGWPPVTWETLPQLLAERRRDYAEYFASLPPADVRPPVLWQKETQGVAAAVAEAAARLFAPRPDLCFTPISQRDNDTQPPKGKHR